jgi:hypothetical protein
VTGATERVAVYGEPPVVVRCGVVEPERVTEQAEINTVPWSIRDSGGSFTWTTIGRTVAVEVVLPDAYEENGFAELIVPLSDAVSASVPAR